MKKSMFPFWSWLASSKPALISTIFVNVIIVLLLITILQSGLAQWAKVLNVIVDVIILAIFWERTAKSYYHDNL
jgi:hypothetical protein